MMCAMTMQPSRDIPLGLSRLPELRARPELRVDHSRGERARRAADLELPRECSLWITESADQHSGPKARNGSSHRAFSQLPRALMPPRARGLLLWCAPLVAVRQLSKLFYLFA